ncbi:MAG: glycosyltransferase 87 family protein [Clostridium sp.]|nr:glycosyltransferase 87 family protein [Clostridium sp.]MCM1398195.1 glycosyltransferase 87 family protein [Clostridium sp.]MCM1460391.1 glycosyltransferase 87 family protein [Bacteroides sp.]
MKPPMSNEKRSKIIIWAFLIALSISHVIFWIVNMSTLGYSMHAIINNYYTESYLDFFKPVYYAVKNNPYSEGLTATPLMLLLGKFAGYFFKHDIFSYDISFLQHFSESSLVLFMAMMMAGLLFALVIFSHKKGNRVMAAWFIFLVFFSTPFMFLYERGSIILLTAALTCIYVYGYDSDDKVTREFSHVALAVAAGLSIYPIIFIILSFRKKRIPNVLRCLLYFALLFFLPVFAFGGLGRLGYYFSNIKTAAENALSAGIAYRIDIISGINLISLCLGKGLIESRGALLVIWAVIVLVLLVCACISKSKWRTVLALSLIAASAPFMAGEQAVAYLILPLIMLIDSDEERIEADFIYTGLYIIMLAPIAIKDCVVNLAGNNGRELYIYSLICTVCVFFMVLMLCIETVAAPLSGIELSKRKREYAKLKEEKAKE